GFDLGGGRRSDAFSVASSEAFALPRAHPGLRDVGVYLGWAGPLSRAVQAMSAGASLVGRLPGARDAIGGVLKPLAPGGATGGPAPGGLQQRLGPALVALAAALLLGAVLRLARALLGAARALAQVAGVEVVRADRLLDEHEHLLAADLDVALALRESLDVRV